MEGRGAAFDETLAMMRRVWTGELVGASGPMPALPAGRPGMLIGGLAPASFRRAAAVGQGWVAPLFGLATLNDGIASVRRAWNEAGRSGQPRVVVERYFCLGADADAVADHYVEHYYTPGYFAGARADTLTSRERLLDEIGRVATTGCDDLLLLPCSGAIEQVELLADALADVGWES
jgi:alkanesulfonate monooxygenase SsuD/methylene tetrahydromethanopterin reductase-like flavin-dependent oxidoreductase (luciferase family)